MHLVGLLIYTVNNRYLKRIGYRQIDVCVLPLRFYAFYFADYPVIAYINYKCWLKSTSSVIRMHGRLRHGYPTCRLPLPSSPVLYHAVTFVKSCIYCKITQYFRRLCIRLTVIFSSSARELVHSNGCVTLS